MAYFDVTPTDTNAAAGAQTIAAASAGDRARWLSLIISNNTAASATRIVRIYDGTAAAGTIRMAIALRGNETIVLPVPNNPGHSLFMKSWWTAGNAIAADLDGTGSVRIQGEVIREP